MTNFAKLFAAAALMITTWTALPSDSQAYNGGDYCREYTRTVYIGNRREEAYGTACLRPDGQWEIVNESNLRPVSYDNYVTNNRTVYVQQPTQIVYRDRSPTRVFFFGSPRRDYNWNRGRDRYDRYDRHDRHDRHDHGRGRGHGHGHR